MYWAGTVEVGTPKEFTKDIEVLLAQIEIIAAGTDTLTIEIKKRPTALATPGYVALPSISGEGVIVDTQNLAGLRLTATGGNIETTIDTYVANRQ